MAEPEQAAPPARQAAGERPGTVTAFGILNIVFGGLSVIGAAASIVELVSGESMRTLQTIGAEAPGAVVIFGYFSSILGIGAAGVLVASGIGLLMMQNWARICSIVWAIYDIVMTVLDLGVTLALVVVPVMGGPYADEPRVVATLLGSLFVSVIFLVYPVLLLIFMARSNVKAALAGK